MENGSAEENPVDSGVSSDGSSSGGSAVQDNPDDSDEEELITVYLFGLGQHLSTRKAIYKHTKGHLLDWFPKLPSYQAFCRSLNWLAGAFQALAEIFGEKMLEKSTDTYEDVIASIPIMLARRSNSTRAKAGRPLCNKCFSFTQKEWSHGVKLHVLAILQRFSYSFS